MCSGRPSEPGREELIREVAEFFSAYVGAGVSMRPFADDFTPNLDIKNLDQLLEYYFLLTGEVLSPDITTRSEVDLSEYIISDKYGTPIGVLDFTSLLNGRIRSLDPEIQKTTEVFRNEVPGRINWNQTIKHRYISGNPNSQDFACQVQDPSFNSSRNRVLVELLTQIESIFTRFDEQVSTNDSLEWFGAWLQSNGKSEALQDRHNKFHRPQKQNLRAAIKTALNQTQLSTIDRQSVKVSDDDIRQVRLDRSPLYREAAELLAIIRQLKRGTFDEEFARSFLRSQIIHPPNDEEVISSLFEMYWIFKLMDTFEHPKRRLFGMTEDQDLIGKWKENDSIYLLFNDWDGYYNETEYLSFEPPSTGSLMLDDPEHREVPDSSNSPTHSDFHQRLGSILANKYLIEREVFGHTPARKTPDIVLLRCAQTGTNPVIESVFVGEVKHSTGGKTLRGGVLQLLEYGAFARVGDDAKLQREHNGQYLSPDILNGTSPHLKLGYFVGHEDALSMDDSVPVQVRGFGHSPSVVLQD